MMTDDEVRVSATTERNGKITAGLKFVRPHKSKHSLRAAQLAGVRGVLGCGKPNIILMSIATKQTKNWLSVAPLIFNMCL